MTNGQRLGRSIGLGIGVLLACGCSAANGSANGARQGQPSGTGSAGTSARTRANDAGLALANPAAVSGGSGATINAPIADSGAPTPKYAPRAGLDKTAEFTWTQSLPGQGTCKAGKYTGTFNCTYIPKGGSADGGSTDVSGPITMTLQKSMNGEFLEVANGDLNGFAVGIVSFIAQLVGKLDCTTQKFQATALNGAYGLFDAKVLPLGTLDGTLDGTFDNQALTLSGIWALTEASGGTCTGPWTASYTP